MRAQLDVISRLNRVSGLPDKIGGPYVNNYSSNDTLTFFFIQQLPGAKGQIDDHQALIEARVKPGWSGSPGCRRSTSRGSTSARSRSVSTLTAPPSWGGDPGTGQSGQHRLGRLRRHPRHRPLGYKLRFAGRYDVATLGTRWWTGATACPSICGM